MLFAAEISYQCISIEDLQNIAKDLQRALPGITVTAIDKRSRPTSLQSDDLEALKLREDDRKKPFMFVGPEGAVIASEQSEFSTLETALGLLSEKLEFREAGSAPASTGVICTLGFIVIFAFVLAGKAIPESAVLTSILLIGSLLFFAGLTLFGVRSLKAPRKGRSVLSMILMLPGFLMMAPLSVLNIPLINYFRREHGRRLRLESHNAASS